LGTTKSLGIGTCQFRAGESPRGPNYGAVFCTDSALNALIAFVRSRYFFLH
jgi:hypothetical protein